MILIPGLPYLERKPDLCECSVPECMRLWFTTICTWPVCWQHYIDHLDAEGMEQLTEQTHTAKLLSLRKRPVATDGPGRDSASFPSGGAVASTGGVPFVSLRRPARRELWTLRLSRSIDMSGRAAF